MVTDGTDAVRRGLTAARGSVEWGWTVLLVAYVVALVAWPGLWLADVLPDDHPMRLLYASLSATGCLLLAHLGVKLAERLVRRGSPVTAP